MQGLVTTDKLVMPQGADWLIILAIGGISVVAQFFLTGAFVTTNAVVAQFHNMLAYSLVPSRVPVLW